MYEKNQVLRDIKKMRDENLITIASPIYEYN